MKPFSSPKPFVLVLIAVISAAGLAHLPIAQAGGPAGDAIMILNCIGILPSTPNCVDGTLGPFESLVYDSNGNGIFDLGEGILGPTPSFGATLSDDPRINYRDSTSTGTTWAAGEPIFVDQDGNLATTGDRVFLLGTPTLATTNIHDDPLIKFVDHNSNSQIEGLVMVTARLERVGGTNATGGVEDVDGIQAVFTYNQTTLQVTRVSYPGTVLPDQSRYSKAVRDHCTGSGGSPFDTVSPDETAGVISSSHFCVQGGLRTPDIGIGCDPNIVTGCPGDPATGGPLQNLDAVRVQFLVLSRANFTFSQIENAPGVSGTYIRDVDSSDSLDIPLELAGALFDNRRTANQPPTASFTFAPTKAPEDQAVSFDGRSSSDQDGVITNYAWVFGDGETATGSITQHAFANPGNYTVKLTVTDDDGLTNQSSQVVEANARVDLLPVAMFTFTPEKATVNVLVRFDGSGSYDPDGGVLSYDWDFGDGQTSMDSRPTHTYSTSNTYTVTLTVVDDEGSSGTVTHMLVVNSDNTTPTASFTFTPSAIIVGQSVSFDGSSSSDPDGTIASYSWNFGDDTTGTGPTPTHAYNTLGVMTITLTVTDNDGATDSFSRALTVLGITLTITVRDSTGSLVSGANVSITSTPTGQAPPPAKITGTDGIVIFQNLLPGAYTYSVTATGYESATKTLTIQPGTPSSQDSVNLTSIAQVPSAPIDYTLYLGVAVALALVGAGVFLYLRRRRTATTQSRSS